MQQSQPGPVSSEASKWCLWLIACATLLAVRPLLAQTNQSQVPGAQPLCILAGSINKFEQWFPKIAWIDLFDANGNVVNSVKAEELAKVKTTRLNGAVRLATCARTKPASAGVLSGGTLSASPSGPVAKEVPALSANVELLEVKALSMVPVGIGGFWVELEVLAPQSRFTTLPAQED